VKHSSRAARKGYTYIIVLVLLAVIALGSALTLEVAHTSSRREAEAELVAVGKEFERAFASYHRLNAGSSSRYPARLEDLVRDPRVPGIRRHLRRLHVDPVTGGPWGTVPAPGGGIMAVFSTSMERPLREDIGPLAMAPFGAASSVSARAEGYARWQFGYAPAGTAALPRVAAP
jgi:hypothetical protein